MDLFIVLEVRKVLNIWELNYYKTLEEANSDLIFWSISNVMFLGYFWRLINMYFIERASWFTFVKLTPHYYHHAQVHIQLFSSSIYTSLTSTRENTKISQVHRKLFFFPLFLNHKNGEFLGWVRVFTRAN